MFKTHNSKMRFLIFAVGIAGVLTLLLLIKPVSAMVGKAHAGYVYLRVESELLRSTPAGRYYRVLAWRSNDELIRLLYKYPEESERLFEIMEMFVPALEALLDGHGETVTISAEQVAAFESGLDWLSSVSDGDLPQVIEKERQRLPLQDFVGMTAQEAWDYANAHWSPNTPEEQAMSEFSALSPLSPPDRASTPIPMEHYTQGNISIDYPAGWSYAQGDGMIVTFNPPADLPLDSNASAITMQSWFLPPEQEGSLDPAFSQPAGYSVVWQANLTVGDLRGVEYAWGQPGGDAILYVRLYSETQQTAIQISMNIKNPEELKMFGSRYMLYGKYPHFSSMVSGLKFIHDFGYTTTPMPTIIAIPMVTPSLVLTLPLQPMSTATPTP